jgi:hypothetical protein
MAGIGLAVALNSGRICYNNLSMDIAYQKSIPARLQREEMIISEQYRRLEKEFDYQVKPLAELIKNAGFTSLVSRLNSLDENERKLRHDIKLSVGENPANKQSFGWILLNAFLVPVGVVVTGLSLSSYISSRRKK